MCLDCEYRRICKYKYYLELFSREVEEMKKEYELPNLDTQIICREHKGEEF